MGSFGQVRLRTIFRMLEECAPGHSREEKVHHIWVRYEGKTYTSLPKGAHGKKAWVEIQLGHVRSMVRFLGIDPECARRMIPQLA